MNDQSDTKSDSEKKSEPNAQSKYKVSKNDLPLHCPMEGMRLWDSHPRVYLPIEETGQAKCPYCGADFELSD